MFWFEDEVKSLEKKKFLDPLKKKIVFYGSSSIRLWGDIAASFPDYNILNLGFGGSTLAACAWYFERVVVPYHPQSLIIYAGDNDLGDGRHPEEVLLFLVALMEKASLSLKDANVSFLSVKPSIARWDIIDRIRYTNQIIQKEIHARSQWHYIDVFTPMLDANGYPRKELFQEDGLHLSVKGYQVWQEVIGQNSHIIF
ncbi:SGNH/GDSL hydrolase family protein [Xanthocytophaga flava]|uniref:SGNH/GDSL hydrolase family protein n=1 Tax=Xanthocytophaga flava TaxID=3048013 RepID=UPI0028D86A57|nr:SGNH/GDSL hydrolase family protein [Xanthocytophaga flavus]MDJ1470420.1 SGNH/GDSL hydrolase family protein [Xanthocytophaga flavus]